MRLVGKGVMPWDIDKALNDFGFKMGPFQMSDLAGLDLGWSKGVKTNNPIKDALCELGRRGQKTLRGYYDYDENRTPIPSKETEKVIKAITNVDQTTMPKEKIIELVSLISKFNAVLKEKSTEIGFGFLDVYKLTNRGDGLSNQSWHIDEYHLSPEGMNEAWRIHFVN